MYRRKRFYLIVSVIVIGAFLVFSRADSSNTLYDAVANDSLVAAYTGDHQDSLNNPGTKGIYYFTGSDDIVNHNNVKLGDTCWQILRTTDTGGVKMIYNGEYDETNKCNTSRGTHKGIIGTNGTTTDLNSSYKYGDSFTYDEEEGEFTLTNSFTETFNGSTYKNLLGKYTCASSSDTCATIYNINGYKSGTTAYTTYYTVGSSVNRAQIGTSPFNANNDSLAMVGYMFNSVYNYEDTSPTNWGDIVYPTYTLLDQSDYSIVSNYSSPSGYPYTWDSTNKTWTSAMHQDDGYSTIIFKVTTAGDYKLSYTVSCEAQYDEVAFYRGTDYLGNFDGEASGEISINNLQASEEIKVVYSKDEEGSSGNDNVVFSLSEGSGTPTADTRYVVGGSFTYSNGTYTLQNTKRSNGKDDLSNHHYTCLSTGNTCQSLKYVFYREHTSNPKIFYVALTSGKSIDDAKNEMLYNEDVNKYNSSIKGLLEAWYAQKMDDYTDLFEDTIYCNNRVIRRDATNNGWNSNGGSTSVSYQFDGAYTSTVLECPSETDKFAVGNAKAKNKYPVGLATYTEMNLISNNTARRTGASYYHITPRYFSNSTRFYTFSLLTSTDGIINGNASYLSYGVRPVVSLKSGTTYTEGTGTQTDPYVVEIDTRPKISTSVANGTITETTRVSSGANKTIKYNPNKGYELKSVIVDGDPVDISTYANSYIFTNVTANHTIKVSYKKSDSGLYDAIANDSLTSVYSGEHQDSLDGSGTETIHYFGNSEDVVDHNNVKLGDTCWQILRTTDTGGVKMIYNGEYDSTNKCNTSRGNHTGFVGTAGTYQTDATDLSGGTYKYADSFTWSGTTFTLVNPTSATWSDSTYTNLVGKYTCKNSNNSCTTLYYVGSKYSSTKAYTTSYTISSSIGRAQIGTSPFNANRFSPAMVGYMFNKSYDYAGKAAPTSGSLMGSGVTYSNGTYTLVNTSTTKDATHHYSCNNSTGTCSTVRYYYYNNYYIELSGEANIEAVVDQMLYDNDVNKYNSAVKALIESWYGQELSDYTSLFEDAIYCNDRTQRNASTNGWNKSGTLTTDMYFKDSTSNSTLRCGGITDQFAVANSKAKNKYPVGLATYPEAVLASETMKSTNRYWLLSPMQFYADSATERVMQVNPGSDTVYFVNGVRPVVSLKAGIGYASGSGSQDDPYVIDFRPTITTEVVHGTITKTTQVEKGSKKTITYNADDGYTLKSVTVDGESVSISTYANKYTFNNIIKDHTIKVVYGIDNTLYDAVAADSLTSTYSGEHQDSLDNSGTETIHYFTGSNDIINHNNVKLGNTCWQILRTTDTGGVKMIYNGEYDSTNKCNTSRGDHTGIVGTSGTTTDLSGGEYQYGDSFTYNESTGLFTLTNPSSTTWSDSTYKSLLGKYTCISSSNTCTTIYNVNSYYSSTLAYTTSYTVDDTNYAQIGTSVFNATNGAPAVLGYMKNTTYPRTSQSQSTSSETVLQSTTSLFTTSMYYGTSISYTSSKYKLGGTINQTRGASKYSVRSTSSTGTGSTGYYITNVSGSTYYYITMTGGSLLAAVNKYYRYGTSYSGTTINNATNIRSTTYYSNRSNLTNKYYCSGTSSTVTCNPKYAVAVSATAITYIAHDGFKYGSNVSYSNGTYTLTNTIAGYPDATHHYTCKTTGTTCSTVYYVYYYTRGTSGANKYFIELSDGKKIDEAITAMLDDDGVNRYNSSIKGQIEAWYGQNMTDYTDLFEDAIYCNDRTRTNQSTSGLDPSGGLTTAMTFSDRNGNTTLKCSRQIDQFAVGNSKAKNKYPVGLATYAEMNLLDNDTARTTGVQYLTGSPNSLANNGPNESYITTSGTLSNTIVTTAYGTRPVVSLKSGVTYRSGTGSQTDPYIIDVYDRSGTALFDTGQNVNAKIKSLVAGSSKLYSDTDSTVQAIKRANDLPDGFTPSSDNTVSTSTSEKPIYIFYDSTTNTVYYYSEAETVYLNPDSSYLFGCFESLTNISGLSQLNTSKVKNMTYMFRNCISLADINALSNWNTSRVIKMMDLFYYCKSLTDIGALGNWDTSNVANMSNMFYNCRLLENIDGASSWDTSNATRMDHMFWYCVSLEDIDGASNWDTSNVTRMDYMFYYCSPLTDIDALSNWDTSNVTNMSNMFYYCSSLTDIDALSDWDTSSVTDMSYMFYHCSSLDNIDALSDWDTSSVTNMYYMFGYCSSLEDIDGASNWDTSSVSNVSYVFIGATKAAGTFPILGNPTTYDGAFINAATAADTRITVVYDCVITQNIDAIIATKSASSDVVKGSCTGGNKTVFDTGKNVNAKIKTLVAGSSQAYTATDSTVEAIKRASALPDGFTPSADNTISISGSEYPIYIFYDNTTHTVYYYSQAETVYLNPDSSYLFDVFASLTDTSGLSQVNTSKVKNMSYMFYSCSSLEDIDGLSNWDTSSVTNMTYMLSNCSSLTDIDALSNWDTSSTTNMSYMFRYSSSLVNINALSDWDTSSVTDISNIFAYCSSLANIDGASDWDTSNVTNMAYMFRECVALVDMDALLDWDISSVTDMSYMFYGCTSIDDIDALSNWDTSSVTNMSYMFRNCSALEDIDGASNWDTSNVTNVSNVFAYATKASGIFPILGNPTSYGSAFTNAATYTDALLTQIRVKYSCDVTTNIDAIVATKSSGSNVVKDSECANVIDNSYVTITNQIQGNMGNVRKYFSYTVEVRDANNVIDNNLSTSFTLKNDQSEILSIPEGYTVRVTQAEENAYTTTVNNTRSRVIAEEVVGDMTITYKNSYDLSVDTGVKTIIPPYIVLLLLSILTLLGIGYISKKLELD